MEKVMRRWRMSGLLGSQIILKRESGLKGPMGCRDNWT